MTALLLGATGLVGSHVLPLFVKDDRWTRVVTLGRRPMPSVAPHHVHHVVDFERLAEHPDLFACDDVFCCLGTTMKQAGSEDAFRRIDRDYPFTAAQLARSGGATQFLLVSSVGADPASRFFYTRIKGETETAIRDVGFESTGLFRPAQLDGDRAEERTGERLALGTLRLARPLLVGPLRRYRAIAARTVAQAMVAVARAKPPGVRVYESEEIEALA